MKLIGMMMLGWCVLGILSLVVSVVRLSWCVVGLMLMKFMLVL